MNINNNIINRIMKIGQLNSRAKRNFIFILFINSIMCGLIALDFLHLEIPVLRQIVGFIYLSIIPGFVILQLINVKKLKFTEWILLSLGLSLSFLMILGLLFNNFLLFVGYNEPLGTIPLLLFLVLFTTIFSIIACMKKRVTYFKMPELDLSKLYLYERILIIPLFFPLLSIFGTYYLNTTGNNVILMIFLILIPLYVILITLTNKFPKKFYPFVIFLISLSILLLGALRSNHIIGIDAHYEYYLFQNTLNNLSWKQIGFSVLDVCISISLLPTIYASILKLNPELLFRLLYPLLFSFVPLIVYSISAKYIKNSYAFLASFFFMSQIYFFNTVGNARTSIAILFFALAIFVFFTDKITIMRKKILFIIFIISCVLSHYSTNYEFLWVIIGTSLSLIFISIFYKKFHNVNIISRKELISINMMLLFFALIVLWYSQLNGKAFNGGLGFIVGTIKNLNNFFILDSRKGIPALVGSGIEEKGIPQKVQFIFTWLTLGLMGLGVIGSVFKYKNMSFERLNFEKFIFLRTKFEITFLLMVISCSLLLLLFFALPFVSVVYSIDRTFEFTNIILSSFFVLGGIILSIIINKILSIKKIKINPHIILLFILIPYFLCISGFMYNLFGDDRSILLNSHGTEYEIYYIHDQESYTAKWLYNYQYLNKVKPIRISSADYIGGLMLISQGGFSPFSVDIYAFKGLMNKDIKGYIFLRYYNVVNGKLVGLQYDNMSSYSDKLSLKNKIYTSGGAEILYS